MRWIAILLLILVFWATPVHASTVAVTVTAFTKNGTMTSIGTKPRIGKTAAVSRDLRHLLGRKVLIKGYGVRHIESLTNKRLRRTVDVLVESRRVARDFGRVKGKIVLIGG